MGDDEFADLVPKEGSQSKPEDDEDDGEGAGEKDEEKKKEKGKFGPKPVNDEINRILALTALASGIVQLLLFILCRVIFCAYDPVWALVIIAFGCGLASYVLYKLKPVCNLAILVLAIIAMVFSLAVIIWSIFLM